MKILVVEDDKFLANAYRVKLGNEGYEVKLVDDGSKVFETLEYFEPDLILLDLILPSLDGFDILKALKENEKFKSIPVIISSNLGQDEDQEKAMSLGAEGYIIKSDLRLTEIMDKIEEILSKS